MALSLFGVKSGFKVASTLLSTVLQCHTHHGTVRVHVARVAFSKTAVCPKAVGRVSESEPLIPLHKMCACWGAVRENISNGPHLNFTL